MGTLAIGLLAGCSALVPPAGDPDSPAVPLTWSIAADRPGPGATAADTLAAWWRRFDDPTLSALVTDALRANNDLRSAAAALRQARALREVQAAALRPSLSAAASAQRNRSNGASANRFQAELDASWVPDVAGGTRAAVAAADADARASAASLGDTQVSVAAEVALAYIELRSAQVRLGIARDNLASQQDTLQIADWRSQAGLATPLDVEQARTAAEQTRAQIPLLDTSAAQARHRLALLTGRPPAALDAMLADAGHATAPAAEAHAPAVPQAPDALALAFPAQTLRQRADVRAAEHRVAAAAARVTAADAARLPSFQIGGTLGLSALTLGSLTGSGALAGSLLGSVSLPLFDGGAARAQVDAQQAALDQARAAYRSAVLGALKEVEDALVALRNDRERVATLRRAAASAADAGMLARQRYASGLVDFQTVLDTQRTLLGVQDSVAAGAADLASDHVRLYQALGGGWDGQTADDTETLAERSPAGPSASATSMAPTASAATAQSAMPTAPAPSAPSAPPATSATSATSAPSATSETSAASTPSSASATPATPAIPAELAAPSASAEPLTTARVRP